MSDEGWVTLGQAVRFTGRTERTIRRWAVASQIASEKLPTGRWRFRLADLARMVGIATPQPLHAAQPNCEICGLPYHRYSTGDPEHDYDPVACINALRGRHEADVALIHYLEALLREARLDLRPGSELDQRIARVLGAQEINPGT